MIPYPIRNEHKGNLFREKPLWDCMYEFMCLPLKTFMRLYVWAHCLPLSFRLHVHCHLGCMYIVIGYTSSLDYTYIVIFEHAMLCIKTIMNDQWNINWDKHNHKRTHIHTHPVSLTLPLSLSTLSLQLLHYKTKKRER